MPITAAAGSIWEVRFNGKLEEQDVKQVMHFTCVGASSDVNVGLILKIIACFVEHLLPVLTTQYTLNDVSWKQVGPTLGVEQVTVPSGSGTGGGGSSPLPSYVSAVISKRTTLGGRTHRGRMYIGGIDEGDTLGSEINPASPLWAGILAFIVCVLANFRHPDPAGGVDIFDMIVYSRKLGGATFPYTTPGSTSIDNLIPVKLLGTTRSRKVGRGS